MSYQDTVECICCEMDAHYEPENECWYCPSCDTYFDLDGVINTKE